MLYKNTYQELNDAKVKLNILKNVDYDLNQAKISLTEKDMKINNLENLLQQEKHSYEELLIIKEKEIEMYQKRYMDLELVKEELTKNIENLEKSISENKVNVEGTYLNNKFITSVLITG